MNICTFTGRLTADPEIKTTNSGKSLVTFSLAVDREYKNADGSKPVDYIPCIAWDPVASIIFRYSHKGNKIGITGRFESSNYEDSNGNKKTFNRILVNNVEFLQSKSESKPQDAAPEAPKKKIDPAGDPNIDYPYYTDDPETELPFPI